MQIDGFRVLRVSHEGSYGPVVQAEDTQSGKLVAIQVFTGPFKQPQASVQGLQAHLQTLQSLNLPGVAIPLRCGELSDGRLFLASTWVAGSTLPAGRQPLADALYWTQRIAAALEVAHRHGIYHQHLRPSQILHSAGRSARQCMVLGMGLARLFGLPIRTQNSASLAFLAPERRHDEGGAAADVYSLGMLLRALLGLPVSPPEPAGARPTGELSVAQPIMDQLTLLIAQMTATDPAQRMVMSEVNVHLHRLCKLRPVGLRVPRLAAERELPKGDLRARSTLDVGTDGDLDSTITMPREQLPAATPVASDKDPLIGQVFGQFRLLRRLGSGAMGTVYEGRHELIGHRAAVKVLRPQFGSAKEYARRFIDEARAVNIVEHRGLVSVTDCGQREDGLLFTVMELLSGETLEAALARRTAPPNQREALGILLQIARALAATHACGIIHRDLKPSNIMLVPDELVPDRIRVKILDFGIAKVATSEQSEGEHTQTGVSMGTPRYMAPEQYGKAKEVDGKADVFALGALTYEMLTGRSPFGESSSLVAVAKPPMRLRAQHYRVSPALDELVARMLNPQPTDRPSMQAVVDGLEQLHGRRALLMRLVPASVLVVSFLLLGAVWILLTKPPSLTKLQRKHREVRERAGQVLRDALTSSQPSEVRAVAALELGQTHAPAYREWLVPLLKDADLQVAGAAVDALGELGDDQAGPALRELLDNGPKELRIRAALALSLLRPASVSQPGRDYLHKQLDRALQLARPETVNLQARLAAQLYRVGDKTYAEQLLGWLGQPELPISLGARLTYLEQLVGSAEKGEQARHQLQALATQPDEDQRLAVIASLQRLGLADAAARTQLTAAAQSPGQHQAMAAWLLSRNGDDSFCERFGELVRDAAQDVRVRQMAADALSRCGFAKAQMLVPLLDKLDGSADTELRKLRVIYAGALLRIVGPPTARSAESQRNLVDALLRGGKPADYVDAIAILDTQPDDLSVDFLGEVLGNPQAETEVRKAAARALGKKQLRAALNVLGLALQDANADVRETGMRAILQLMQELNQPERSGLSGSALELLHKLVETSTDERERIVARLLLVRYGERGQLAPLVLLMSKPDREDLRLLIVELAAPDSELVRMALRDPSVKVRFFAARRRVEAGGRDAIPVLQEMLARRGEEALLSYWMLRRLGELEQAPTYLSDLLGRGAELYTRIEVVRVLGQLPLKVALPLLLQARSDPASMVRREVAISAWTLYGKSHDSRLIDLLDSLLSDAEAVVRLKAQSLLGALLPATAPPLARAVTAADMASALTPPPGKVTREAVTPAQVDAPPAPTPDASTPSAVDGALPISPEPVQPPPRTHTPVRLPAPSTPAQLGQAWLAESHNLVARGDKAQALAVLSKALGELKDDPAKPIYSRISWERGEILADQGQLGEALKDYNRVWNRYHGAPPAPMASIEQKFEQLKAKVGRLDIYIKKQNDCVCDSSLLMLGGTPLAFTYKGRIRVEAKILAGRVQQKGECTPTAK